MEAEEILQQFDMSDAPPAQPSAPTGGGGLGGMLGGMLGGRQGGGGGGGLGGLASMLDMDGDGNPLDDIMRMLGKKG